jgi:hypothetical protein
MFLDSVQEIEKITQGRWTEPMQGNTVSINANLGFALGVSVWYHMYYLFDSNNNQIGYVIMQYDLREAN